MMDFQREVCFSIWQNKFRGFEINFVQIAYVDAFFVKKRGI